jgi:hypothetical protein
MPVTHDEQKDMARNESAIGFVLNAIFAHRRNKKS